MAAAVVEELVTDVPRAPRTPVKARSAPGRHEIPETTPVSSSFASPPLAQPPDSASLQTVAAERLNRHWIDPELGDGVPTGTAMIELIAFVGVLVLSADALVTVVAGQPLNAGHWFVIALMAVAAVATLVLTVRRFARFARTYWGGRHS